MQDGLRRKQQIQRALQELDETDKKKVNPADPEARFMKHRGRMELSYNGQAIADQDSGMIVGADVVTDSADNGQLVPMIDQAKENVGAVAEENVADAGYFSSSQIGLAADRCYEVLVSENSAETKSKRSAQTNPYDRSRFVYDEERDCCMCPGSKELQYDRTVIKKANRNEVRRYRCRDYRTCPDRWKCSQSKTGRIIEISVHRNAVERHGKKRELPENKRRLKARKGIIEPVFGWIKQQLGFRRWTLWGIEGVRAQWNLICTTINLKKLYPYWVSGSLAL
jgi:ABC-2 type transport system ATP-binding protein/transposase